MSFATPNFGQDEDPNWEPTILMVPVSSVSLSDCNVRLDFGISHSFLEDVLIHGVKKPLRVKLVRDHYVVIDGDRRLIAAKAIGLVLIPVQV